MTRPPPPLRTWSEALVELRQRAGLSQRELADLVGTSQASVDRWEDAWACGDSGIRLGWLEKLARVYSYKSVAELVAALESLR